MRFYTAGLLSKWGFEDGDLLFDLLFDLLADNDVELVDEHPLLIEIVEKHVIPKIVQEIEIIRVNTIHNPIRADRVDGIYIDTLEDNSHITLEPEYVDVPDSVVLEAAKRLSK